MIELRWLDIERDFFDEFDGWHKRGVTVLQYRQEEVSMLGNWTEWQDVPVVKDDTNNRPK